MAEDTQTCTGCGLEVDADLAQFCGDRRITERGCGAVLCPHCWLAGGGHCREHAFYPPTGNAERMRQVLPFLQKRGRYFEVDKILEAT